MFTRPRQFLLRSIIASFSMSVACTNLMAQAADNSPMNPEGVDDLIRHVASNDSGRQTRQWLPMLNTRSKWANSVYMWYLNPAYMPSQLSQNAVIATMQLVTSRWSQMCNIEFRYMGLSTAQPLATVGSNQDQINVLSWGRFAGGMTGIAAYAAVNIITSAGVSTLEDVDIIVNNEMVTQTSRLPS